MQALLDEFAANRSRASKIVHGCTVEQLNWQPSGGWSIAQCVEHLATVNTLFAESIKEALEARSAGSPLALPGAPLPRFLDSVLVRMIEPPVRVKWMAPKKARPQVRQWGTEVLDIYLMSHQKLCSPSIINAASEKDPVRFRHPFRWMQLRLDLGLRLMAAHDRRHLWQAEKAMALQTQK